MATVTPNFNWPVPTSTDLVKDGATAMEALGDSIDASFVGLKGGNTDQVLAKGSPDDLDFVWVDADDSNAIQNSIVNAKGDLIGASANDTPAILSVGANNTVLIADSTTSTGLAWAGGWTSYTPTVTGNSAFTLGNGTLVGRYVKIGKTVTVSISLLAGSTTSFPTAYTLFSAPFSADNVSNVGSALYEDSGGSNYGGQVGFFGVDNFLPYTPTAGATSDFVTNTKPFTWGSGDVVRFTITYQAA